MSKPTQVDPTAAENISSIEITQVDSAQDGVSHDPSVRQMGEWAVVTARSRVDSFSYDQLMASLKALKAAGHTRIAIDLKGTRFMSLQAIRFCVDVARELVVQRGKLALIAPAEKTKRHFMIYGSLEHIQVVRSVGDLTGARERSADPTL